MRCVCVCVCVCARVGVWVVFVLVCVVMFVNVLRHQWLSSYPPHGDNARSSTDTRQGGAGGDAADAGRACVAGHPHTGNVRVCVCVFIHIYVYMCVCVCVCVCQDIIAGS